MNRMEWGRAQEDVTISSVLDILFLMQSMIQRLWQSHHFLTYNEFTVICDL